MMFKLLVSLSLMGYMCLYSYGEAVAAEAIQNQGWGVIGDIQRYDYEVKPSYWVEKEPQGTQILLQSDQLAKLNETIRANAPTLHNLDALPDTYTVQDVVKRIKNWYPELGDPKNLPLYYVDDVPLDEAYLEKILQNRNLADKIVSSVDTKSISTPVKNKRLVPVRYAVVTERANLRLMPTADGWYDEPNDVQYDQLQGTVLDPAEPVAVIWESLDKKFVYVIAVDYEGWVSKQSIGFTDKHTWQEFVQPTDFAVVTNNKYRLSVQDKEQLWQMGAKIPLVVTEKSMMAVPSTEVKISEVRGTLRLPYRKSDGSLGIEEKPIFFGQSLHKGYLPYTVDTLRRQALAFLGDEYGWGGQNESVDCSALVQDVYASMGILLPRDQDLQEAAMPTLTDIRALTVEQRLAYIKQLPIGSLLFIPGHVMIYWGVDAVGRPLVIHSLSSYYTTSGEKVLVRRVMVSDLEFRLGSGKTMLERITAVGTFGNVFL